MKLFFLAICFFACAFAGMEMCETEENLRTGDGKQKYYVRYVLKVKYDESSFTNADRDHVLGEYLSFDRADQDHDIAKKDLVKSQENDDFATFTVVGSKTATQGFRILSKDDSNSRVLSLCYREFFLCQTQKPSMYLNENERKQGESYYFDYKRDTGTLRGAYPLGIIPQNAYVCFQKVDHFKNQYVKQTGKIVDDSKCSPDLLLAPHSSFVEHAGNICSKGSENLTAGSSCKVRCDPEYDGLIGEEKIYTCQQSGFWNYDTLELLQPFKVSCAKQTAMNIMKGAGNELARRIWPINLKSLAAAYLLICIVYGIFGAIFDLFTGVPFPHHNGFTITNTT